MTAITAALDVTAECCGAATLDRNHGVPLRRRQRRRMLLTESRSEMAEHIRHFDPFARHEQARQAGIRAGTLAAMACKASSGLAVAQTLLVAIRRYRDVVFRLRWPSSSWIVRKSAPDSSR